MAAVAISPPPRSGNTIISQQQQPPWKSHSVSRSNEFLSAARTALKIAQQQHHNRQQQIQNGTYIHGGDKENELPEWMINITPIELNLFQPQPSYNNHIDSSQEDDTISLIQDSQTLLKLLDEHLLELHSLVRRRGHTNDPTLEISSTIDKFQEGAQEIKDVCDSLRLAGTKPCNEDTNLNVLYGGGTKRSSTQRRKHYELLSSQLESKAKECTDQLKKELETRSKVLRDQTTRRKMLASGGGGGISGNGSSAPTASGGVQPIAAARLPTQKKGVNTSSQFQSPLFTSTQTGISSGGGVTNRKNATNSTTSKPGGYSGYAGYGGSAAAPSTGYGGTSYGGAGYGGTTTSAPPSFATGMRQRKQQQGGPSYNQQHQQQPKSSIQIDSGQDDDYEDKYTKNGESSVQAQILQRRNNRATKNRAAQARLAEKSIAELGVMFTKMSSLISQQGEVLERIEDDVEAAGLDIDAGHDELVKVYGMTKGNRGLILKVFGILIFLIIFLKLY